MCGGAHAHACLSTSQHKTRKKGPDSAGSVSGRRRPRHSPTKRLQRPPALTDTLLHMKFASDSRFYPHCCSITPADFFFPPKNLDWRGDFLLFLSRRCVFFLRESGADCCGRAVKFMHAGMDIFLYSRNQQTPRVML